MSVDLMSTNNNLLYYSSIHIYIYSKIMKKVLEELGSAIREKRIKLGLSQEGLAHKCNFDRTYISMLERGKRNPSLINIIRLAAGLEMTVSQLTSGIKINGS